MAQRKQSKVAIDWKLEDLIPYELYKTGTVRWAQNHKTPGQLTLSVQLPITDESKSADETGHTKYFVANHRLGIYTCIGADNKHHASNKATKLFGPNGWSFLRNEFQTSPSLDGFEGKPYKEFKELIKTLQN